MGLRKCFSFSFIIEGIVSVWYDTVESMLEDRGDKWRGKRKHEYFVLFRSLFCQCQNSRDSGCQMIAANIMRLCLLDQGPERRCLRWSALYSLAAARWVSKLRLWPVMMTP